MTESGQVERAARRAIARAKSRRSEEVTPDDLLLGLLGEVSRFGVAWIGEWPIDVASLDGGAPGGNGAPAADGDAAAAPAPRPAYSPATVRLFERGAAIARADGARSMGLVHLLVAFAEVECGAMAELRDRYGIDDAEWRAVMARGDVGLPPRLAGAAESGGSRRAAGEAGGGPDILSVDQAADYLGVHAQTVRNYIRSGKLPAYRLAGERYIRVLRKDLLALLERVRTGESEESEESP